MRTLLLLWFCAFPKFVCIMTTKTNYFIFNVKLLNCIHSEIHYNVKYFKFNTMSFQKILWLYRFDFKNESLLVLIQLISVWSIWCHRYETGISCLQIFSGTCTREFRIKNETNEFGTRVNLQKKWFHRVMPKHTFCSCTC